VRGLALFGFGLWRRREGETGNRSTGRRGRPGHPPADGVVSRFVAGRRDTPSFAEADAPCPGTHTADSTRSPRQGVGGWNGPRLPALHASPGPVGHRTHGHLRLPGSGRRGSRTGRQFVQRRQAGARQRWLLAVAHDFTSRQSDAARAHEYTNVFT
jgi:hypothetical protein